MSKSLVKQSTLARLAPVAVTPTVVVDVALATKFLTICQQGDIEACHVMLLKVLQRYPQSVYHDGEYENDKDDNVHTGSQTPAPHQQELRIHQPLYDLLGHGFLKAATANHVEFIEFLLSSSFAVVFRDGICTDAQRFPPFPLLRDCHELACSMHSIRFVAFAALACVDQLAMRSFQFLVESENTLWDFEASLCLSLAMYRALNSYNDGNGAVSSLSASPTEFHSMIVLLAKHYAFLIDEIRQFHEKLRPSVNQQHDPAAIGRFERIQALQASLLYEIVLDSPN